MQKGFITLPDRPGIGVEMNEDAARKAQVPGTPWFEPHSKLRGIHADCAALCASGAARSAAWLSETLRAAGHSDAASC